jgi:hypothetical protein
VLAPFFKCVSTRASPPFNVRVRTFARGASSAPDPALHVERFASRDPSGLHRGELEFTPSAAAERRPSTVTIQSDPSRLSGGFSKQPFRQIHTETRWRYGLFSLDKVMKKAKTNSNPLS